MIMTIDELKTYVDVSGTDAQLTAKLNAIEYAIKGYTNNKFAAGFPPDVKQGAAYMIKWDQDNREKAGVASETISRHSVSYVAQDASNSVAGYPRSVLGFLKPYRKARF